MSNGIDMNKYANMLTNAANNSANPYDPNNIFSQKYESNNVNDNSYSSAFNPNQSAGDAFTSGMRAATRTNTQTDNNNPVSSEGNVSGNVSNIPLQSMNEDQIREFQAQHGLKVDGLAGPETIKAYNNFLSGNDNVLSGKNINAINKENPSRANDEFIEENYNSEKDGFGFGLGWGNKFRPFQFNKERRQDALNTHWGIKGNPAERPGLFGKEDGFLSGYGKLSVGQNLSEGKGMFGKDQGFGSGEGALSRFKPFGVDTNPRGENINVVGTKHHTPPNFSEMDDPHELGKYFTHGVGDRFTDSFGEVVGSDEAFNRFVEVTGIDPNKASSKVAWHRANPRPDGYYGEDTNKNINYNLTKTEYSDFDLNTPDAGDELWDQSGGTNANMHQKRDGFMSKFGSGEGDIANWKPGQNVQEGRGIFGKEGGFGSGEGNLSQWFGRNRGEENLNNTINNTIEEAPVVASNNNKKLINNLENEITEDYTGVENVNLEDSDFDEFGYNTASSTIGGFSPPESTNINIKKIREDLEPRESLNIDDYTSGDGGDLGGGEELPAFDELDEDYMNWIQNESGYDEDTINQYNSMWKAKQQGWDSNKWDKYGKMFNAGNRDPYGFNQKKYYMSQGG